MKTDLLKTASISAEMVAAAGAAEMIRPPEERICFDSYARHFPGRKYRFFLSNKLLTSLALRKSEQTGPVAAGCVISRALFVDGNYLKANYFEDHNKEGSVCNLYGFVSPTIRNV